MSRKGREPEKTLRLNLIESLLTVRDTLHIISTQMVSLVADVATSADHRSRNDESRMTSQR